MPTRKRPVSEKVVKQGKKPSKTQPVPRKKRKTNPDDGLVMDKCIKLVAGAVASNKVELIYDTVHVAFNDRDSLDNATSSSSDPDIEDSVKPKEKKEIHTVFDMRGVEDPLVGTPMEVQKELDALALRLQRHPSDEDAFLKIVCYMHKYILGLVFRKYSFVRGNDDKDIYQEALIALFKKAVPSFRKGKGMSFLNFAKMCINRHLITILNASRNRRKDMPLNTSISLDHSPSGQDDDGSCSLANIIPDKVTGKPPFTDMAKLESFDRTLDAINSVLSDFERSVLAEYLQEKSYRDASRAVSKTHGKQCNERSIDNALLRIRKKAADLRAQSGEDDLPLIFGLNDI